MKLHLYNRHAIAKVGVRHPGATVLDLTSRGPDPWVRFSPFYPHGGVPIPFTEGLTGMSVEGIWQGLKVFETADVDPSKFTIATMKGLKRTVQRLRDQQYLRIVGERVEIPDVEALRRLYSLLGTTEEIRGER